MFKSWIKWSCLLDTTLKQTPKLESGEVAFAVRIIGGDREN